MIHRSWFRHGWVRISFPLLIAVLGSIGLFMAVTYLPVDAAPTASPALSADATPCDPLTGDAQQECFALAALYFSTNGQQWLQKGNWLSTAAGVTPCDWYGITCISGRVTRIDLAHNLLTGELPPQLGALGALTHLILNGNRLFGTVPGEICALQDTVVEADFAYNALDSYNFNIVQCLNKLDPDWRLTQTVAPREATITTISTDTIELSWTPIFYTADGGGYEVSYSTEYSGTYTVHGITADKSATGYTLDGLPEGTTIYFRVRTVTPAHAGNANPIHSQYIQHAAVTVSDETLLLVMYLAFDNDLSPNSADIVQRVRAGSVLNPNIRVVMLIDRAGEDNTDVITVAGGSVTPTDAVSAHWGVKELDTADPDVLSWFLRYARETYPATRTMVSLVGHGVGPAPELIANESPQGRGKVPPLPQGQDYTPGDITSLTYMSTAELGRALAEATDNGANPFDLLFFDQCFQGNLDVLYEVRRAAQIIISSPNYAWLSAPYARYVGQLAPAASLEEIADDIIRIYELSLNQYHPNAIFWLHSSTITDIGKSLSLLGDALRRATASGQEKQILSATLNSRFVDTTQCVEQRFDLAPPDELIGIGRFALNLQDTFPEGDRNGVHQAATNLVDLLATVRRNFRLGQPHIAPDQQWDYDDAMSILAPLQRNLPANVVWRASIYTETAPLKATWTAVPTRTLVISSSLAFAREGRWDDFIAMWYTNLDRPTIGQWCHYTPPAIVVDERAEPLTMKGAPVNKNDFHLQWTATNREDAQDYWLYSRTPKALDWVLQTTLPLTQTTYQVQVTPGAAQEYIVYARGKDDIFVAESNIVTTMVRNGAQGIYLPVIIR